MLDEDNNEIILTIKHLMLEVNMSKQDIADKLGCSRQHIYHVLTGKRNMKLVDIKKIFDAMGYEIEITTHKK